MDIFIYFSDLLGLPVIDHAGEKIGVFDDMALRVTDENFPRATTLVVKRGRLRPQFAEIDWSLIKKIDQTITLKEEAGDVSFSHFKPKQDLAICADILDRQVVDTDHQKVVRVNDVHLLRVDQQLYLAHVDVSLRALLRRLGWGSFIDRLMHLLVPRSAYFTKEEFIPWKYTQVLTLGRTRNLLRLEVARKKLAQIPPTEMAEIMEDLDIFEKYSFFKSLDVGIQRKVFSDMATSEQEELIDQMNDQEAVDLIEDIPSDEAADLLMNLPKEKTLKFMRLMETGDSKRLRKLLGFAKDSAGGLMTTEYLSLPEDSLVEDALQKIKDNVHYPGNIYHIYLVDSKERLEGITPLRRFISEDLKKPLAECCFPKTVSVKTDDGMEEIALLLEKYKFSAIPVVDEQNVLQGVITADDVMEELIANIWGKYKEKL